MASEIRRSKWRQPFTCSRRPEDLETKTKGTDKPPKRTSNAYAAGAPLRPEAAEKREKRRNCHRSAAYALATLLPHPEPRCEPSRVEGWSRRRRRSRASRASLRSAQGRLFETPRFARLLTTRVVGVTKRRGGRRNPLETLNSAKEMEGFNLDLLPVFLGFPSAPAWISFRKIGRASESGFFCGPERPLGIVRARVAPGRGSRLPHAMSD
jgi:hypothetical protein